MASPTTLGLTPRVEHLGARTAAGVTSPPTALR